MFEIVEIDDNLFKMVSESLSIFYGHRAEFPLNFMSNIIQKISKRVNLEAYNAMQDIKYGLKACHPLAQNRCVKEFHRDSTCL